MNRTTHDAHMFYMFFEHRGGGEASKGGRKGGEEKVPVVLWMTGGPGCSSELAAFAENGPFEVIENKDENSEDKYVLKETKYGWDTVGHLLYVDQPVNTGFSWTSDNTDAFSRTKIQLGTSLWAPAACMGSHLTSVPNHQTKRRFSLKTRFVVALFGTFGLELDLGRLSLKERNRAN